MGRRGQLYAEPSDAPHHRRIGLWTQVHSDGAFRTARVDGVVLPGAGSAWACVLRCCSCSGMVIEQPAGARCWVGGNSNAVPQMQQLETARAPCETARRCGLTILVWERLVGLVDKGAFLSCCERVSKEIVSLIAGVGTDGCCVALACYQVFCIFCVL